MEWQEMTLCLAGNDTLGKCPSQVDKGATSGPDNGARTTRTLELISSLYAEVIFPWQAESWSS